MEDFKVIILHPCDLSYTMLKGWDVRQPKSCVSVKVGFSWHRQSLDNSHQLCHGGSRGEGEDAGSRGVQQGQAAAHCVLVSGIA